MRRQCPICRKQVKKMLADGTPSRHFPFCSRHCQLLDLGAWFNGQYSVAAEPEKPGDDDMKQ
ncbi:MAG TPA: DNA gyrase inhibitor YacG [Sedimentisphaerales bacterium]|nr:DNA gyrase inhibitor YacG [Sedimentisphaerales bacterium]